MAAKWKRQPVQAEPKIVDVWRRYGTYIMGVVVVVLLGVLVLMLAERRRTERLVEGTAELAALSAFEGSTKLTQLRNLEQEYADTPLAPEIRLKLAQALSQERDYAAAEAKFEETLSDGSASALVRARAQLGFAYAAQQQGHLADARERFTRVEEQKLYASEARRMIEQLGRMEPQESSEESEPPVVP